MLHRTIRNAALVCGVALLLAPIGATTANADTIVTYSGVGVGGCTIYLQYRTSDGYVRLKTVNDNEEVAAGCTSELYRKRYNDDGSVRYDWTALGAERVVGRFTTAYTGWHWNGTNAGTKGFVESHAGDASGWTLAKW
ncbi:hypothetical protein [Streptosporangium longisporum]|uniref:Uncharacterized protein n=1 Tax=Streptosporangium longisporum TaxID=46187 RepID=A0ABN3XSZ7_9ACTN